MTSPAHALRRAAIALGAASVAVLGVATAATAAAGHPAISFPACSTSQLTGWMGVPGNGAAGSVYYDLQLSNVGTSTCTLFGFPGVSAVNGSGHRLGRPAGREYARPATTQVLAPGATVHSVLRILNPGVIGCPTATAAGLKVYPPNQFRALFVPFSFGTCTGHFRNLTVRAVRHGAGIPGYSQ
ncbi:MAG TPA: DUF4232 domain-containing protein [Streptosporangiaceae bacterium]